MEGERERAGRENHKTEMKKEIGIRERKERGGWLVGYTNGTLKIFSWILYTLDLAEE